MKQQNPVIEWASFNLVEGIDEATLLAASDALQTGFLQKQPGFIKRDLVKGSDGQWADVVYWENLETAQAAMKNAMENPTCFQYFELLAGADHNDPSNGVMHLNVVKSYPS